MTSCSASRPVPAALLQAVKDAYFDLRGRDAATGALCDSTPDQTTGDSHGNAAIAYTKRRPD